MYYDFGYSAGFVLTLGMGVLVIVLQPKRREARLWALLSLWVALWFLVRFLVHRADTPEEALRVVAWGYIPIALINPTYYHFALALVRRPATRFLWMGYGLAWRLE